MPEKFEPIKVVDSGKKIKEFQVDFSEQSLGELGKENTRLKNYMDGQKGLVQKHLDAFKKSALKEYTGTFKWDNEKAVNQAMQDYSDEMNQLLEQSNQDLAEIASKYGDLLGKGLTSETIDEHYKKVAEEFGPKLEARILSNLNSRVGDIVKAAKGRAEGSAAPAPAPESARDRQMREAGVNPDEYKTKRTMGTKGPTQGDVLAGPQDIK